MGRAPCCEKVGLKKGRWTAEEDDILLKYIAAHGEGSWRSLPKNAGLLRCGKSCRLRWINYLRSDLKRGNITPQEEETIINLHTSLGNRWSVIAGHLPGRTDNEIKNYWNSHLSKRINESDHNATLVPAVDPIKVSSNRKGGRRTKSVRKEKRSDDATNEDERVHEKSAQSEGGDSTVIDEAVGPSNRGEDSGTMESGAHVANGEGGGTVVKEEASGEKAVASNEEVKWMDWEMGEMECKLWDHGGVGEMWPWAWDSEKGVGASGYDQLEGTLDSWLSDAL